MQYKGDDEEDEKGFNNDQIHFRIYVMYSLINQKY